MVYNYATVLMIATVALNAGAYHCRTDVGVFIMRRDLTDQMLQRLNPQPPAQRIIAVCHHFGPDPGVYTLSCSALVEAANRTSADILLNLLVAPISKLPTVPATSSLPHSGSPHSSAASFPVPISSGLPKPSGVSVASTKPTPSSGSSAIPSGHLPEFEKTHAAFVREGPWFNAQRAASAISHSRTLIRFAAAFWHHIESPWTQSTATSRSGSPRPSAIVDKRAGNVLLKASGPVPSGVPSPSIVSPLPPHSAASSVSAPVPSGGVASSTVPSPSAPASCEPEPVTSVVSSVLPSGSSPPLPSASATTSVVSIKSALPLSSGCPSPPAEALPVFP
ncbi:hypothetical protein DFH09DRAFT_1099001 [Mycena vulgaris]|nr:hypothetical protein DFH09DRAFT_1099001 [Mycena vulgaris]